LVCKPWFDQITTGAVCCHGRTSTTRTPPILACAALQP
jgi:hypothetical protein